MPILGEDGKLPYALITWTIASVESDVVTVESTRSDASGGKSDTFSKTKAPSFRELMESHGIFASTKIEGLTVEDTTIKLGRRLSPRNGSATRRGPKARPRPAPTRESSSRTTSRSSRRRSRASAWSSTRTAPAAPIRRRPPTTSSSSWATGRSGRPTGARTPRRRPRLSSRAEPRPAHSNGTLIFPSMISLLERLDLGVDVVGDERLVVRRRRRSRRRPRRAPARGRRP